MSKQSIAAPKPDVEVHHHTHSDIVKRLRRTEGHVRSIIGMIESSRPCLDIAQQLYAVEKAISNAKRAFINDHLDDCLEHSINGAAEIRRDAVEEFKEITKYL